MCMCYYFISRESPFSTRRNNNMGRVHQRHTHRDIFQLQSWVFQKKEVIASSLNLL